MARRFGLCVKVAALAGCASLWMAMPAAAQDNPKTSFDIPAQDLGAALNRAATQSHREIEFNADLVRSRRAPAVRGSYSIIEALGQLLTGSGLRARTTTSGAIIVEPANAGTDSSAQNEPTGPDIIVTAQKVREKVQDVPIAISVFSAKALDDQKIEGGSELLRGTPNVSFTKTNFASYNFQIRGIGTQALSVTTDPAVAISFNSMPLVRNRLFEQEYFDVERVEVLRGPQGTLYGRNATAGVVNMIPILADPNRLAGSLKLETGNFAAMRASGMLNLPLTDTLAIRAAGAWTSRDGYDYNLGTQRRVNGRDLWGGRGSIVWKPSSRISASLIWEHFSEDDDRSRTGKQLCHNDPSPTALGGIPIYFQNRGFFSQGCKPGSLYDNGAFGVPNGASLPNVVAASVGITGLVGFTPSNTPVFAIPFGTDPFAGAVQSHDLREIATTYDPRFRARNDIAQFNVEAELSDSLKLVSQTGWSHDNYYSTQDYARFQSLPVFNDTSLLLPLGNTNLLPGGVFCDPQLGCSNKYLAADLVRAKSHQWSQEVRLQSSFNGNLNFNVGINYLKFNVDEDYFLFSNTFSLIASVINGGVRRASPDVPPSDLCRKGVTTPPYKDAGFACIYIDPNPVGQIDGDGHNYFRSRNLANTQSWAGFGEVYWKAAPNLKFTAGLRYTRDIKVTTPYPSQLLLTPGLLGIGLVNSGYPASPDIRQKWGAVTGRFVVDWKPHLSFTDDTLFYASYARGYKAGGTNSPGIGFDPQAIGSFTADARFRPEYVNAFEIGTKNVLAGGRLTLNATAFFYDYKDYQVSQIIDRATKNENFNAINYGLELESIWRPTSRLSFNANLGLLKTRIGNGMKSIDVMDRLQGHDDWVLIKPWIQTASNCIAPKALVEKYLAATAANPRRFGNIVDIRITGFCPFVNEFIVGNFVPGSAGSIIGGFAYDPLTYTDVGQNQGRGFYADLSGKELPNAPHWTFNLGGQYSLPIDNWKVTFRADYYAQGTSWARVYNTVNDRLRGWDNTNLALTVERRASGLAFQFYVKNVFNKTPITGAFINSDDSGLTTNVFTLDPRIVGFSMAKRF
ncbi:MAG: TonB-dependent receptor [Pseudomonadota bacterium]|jgi:outer membrane receptor protein involved in Fe transport